MLDLNIQLDPSVDVRQEWCSFGYEVVAFDEVRSAEEVKKMVVTDVGRRLSVWTTSTSGSIAPATAQRKILFGQKPMRVLSRLTIVIDDPSEVSRYGLGLHRHELRPVFWVWTSLDSCPFVSGAQGL